MEQGLSHWADIIIIVLYFAFVLGVGLWVRLIFTVECRIPKCGLCPVVKFFRNLELSLSYVSVVMSPKSWECEKLLPGWKRYALVAGEYLNTFVHRWQRMLNF